MFLASLLVIGLQTANFAWIWYKYYNVRGVMRFFYWRRGNWALIALYFLTVILVSKLFGALKVGYMRVLDVIIAQIFSVLLTNVLAYLQLALIGRWRFLSHTGPMVKLTFVNLLVVILWVVFMRWIYNTIYPPKSVILVYDVHNPEKLLKNIASRRDKYVIAEAVMIDKGLDFVKENAGDRVSSVKISRKLKNHAVCLSSEGDITLEMEKYFHSIPGADPNAMKAVRVLELNVDHPAIKKLDTERTTDPERAAAMAKVLLCQAELAAGILPEDPAAYGDLVCSLF